MSEQALKDAQLAQAQQENAALKTVIRSMSGTIGAQKNCIDEFLTANLNSRSGNLLLEDDVKNLKKQITTFVERISFLENENAELKRKADELTPEKVEDAA